MNPVDEYLDGLSPDKRAALLELRKTIRSVLPDAEECISYRLPAMRVNGRVVLWFGAATRHCSFYPGGIVEKFAKELRGFETTKGTIRFTPEKPLPAALVKKIAKACAARRARG
jgi:uncharacterized protein YdhG (YjbR/CyaY superfamily)